LIEADKVVKNIALRHLLLRERFRTAWLKENQPYWLNVILNSYDKRINDLKQLSGDLHAAITASNKRIQLPEVSHVRLNIKESPEYYFQNWMFGGPFPFSPKDKIPDFLYSENNEYNKPPIPGDFIHYQGVAYRWQKYASQDGGVIDLDENYKSSKPSLAYAYCNITVELPVTVNAFFAANNGGEIFCNGENVLSSTKDGQPNGEEKVMTLPLKAGVNHLVIKLPKKEGHPWTFTFRLDKDLSVTTHKHKYQLNPKKTTYEAD
jgi:hexosaminidase